MTAREIARYAKKTLRKLHGRAAMSMGRASSASPLSIYWGFDRGRPIDRYYIERFLGDHSNDVKGVVLEVASADYSTRLGGERITRQEVLDADESNRQATIIGDICDPATLPTGAFDCVVLTQTLQLIYDVRAAVTQIRRSLRPGGCALITVCGITSIRHHGDCPWHWSFTEDSLGALLREEFDPDKIEVATFGNLYAATAFLHGAAVEEVSTRKLDIFDPAFPVIIAARAVA